MKKFIILPALALLLTVGVYTIGQQSKSAHAQVQTTVQTQNQVKQSSTVTPEKPETGTELKGTEVDAPGGHQDANSVQDVTDKGSEPKGTETDGPGGHQDAQGANVNYQSGGTN